MLVLHVLVLAKPLDDVGSREVSAHSLVEHVDGPERDLLEDLRIPLDLGKALLLVYFIQTFIQLHEVIVQT